MVVAGGNGGGSVVAVVVMASLRQAHPNFKQSSLDGNKEKKSIFLLHQNRKLSSAA